jgi:hypothetical protein
LQQDAKTVFSYCGIFVLHGEYKNRTTAVSRLVGDRQVGKRKGHTALCDLKKI